MNFYVLKRDDYLEHFSFKKKHKYVRKIGTGKDARYFYSEAEYQAYLNGNDPDSKTDTALKSNVKKGADFLKKSLSVVKKNAQNVNEDINRAKEKAEKSSSLSPTEKARLALESGVHAAKVAKKTFDHTKDPVKALDKGAKAAKTSYGAKKVSKVAKKYSNTFLKELYYQQTKNASKNKPVVTKDADGNERTSYGYNSVGKETYEVRYKDGSSELYTPDDGILGLLGMGHVSRYK